MELYYPNVLRMFCLFGYEAIFISNVSYPVIVKLNLSVPGDELIFRVADLIELHQLTQVHTGGEQVRF